MRRTISNLSRTLKVSRPLIYKTMDRLGLKKAGHAELGSYEWDELINDLRERSDFAQQKIEGMRQICESAICTQLEASIKNGISVISNSTLRARLDIAKQEFDFNRNMIVALQGEISDYVKSNGKLTVRIKNGSEAPLPAVVSMREAVKQNSALSKLISDIEADLDLSDGVDFDPFI